LSEETIRRANEARQLLANPLLIEAFERVEAKDFEDALEVFDADEKLEFLRRVQALRAVRVEIETMILEGNAEVRPRPTAA
jgi:hypothetical protein